MKDPTHWAKIARRCQWYKLHRDEVKNFSLRIASIEMSNLFKKQQQNMNKGKHTLFGGAWWTSSFADRFFPFVLKSKGCSANGLVILSLCSTFPPDCFNDRSSGVSCSSIFQCFMCVFGYLCPLNDMTPKLLRALSELLWAPTLNRPVFIALPFGQTSHMVSPHPGQTPSLDYSPSLDYPGW